MTTATSCPAYGDEAQYLPKGSTTPFEGYLLTVPETQTIRKKIIEGESWKVQSESWERSFGAQEKLIETEQKKNTLYSEQNDKLAKQLADAQSTSSWERVLWVTLGVVGTLAAVWVGKQATK